jgi:hypothetical protein
MFLEPSPLVCATFFSKILHLPKFSLASRKLKISRFIRTSLRQVKTCLVTNRKLFQHVQQNLCVVCMSQKLIMNQGPGIRSTFGIPSFTSHFGFPSSITHFVHGEHDRKRQGVSGARKQNDSF